MKPKFYMISKADDHARLLYAASWESLEDAETAVKRRSSNSPEFVYRIETDNGEIISEWQNGERIESQARKS